MLKVKTGRFPKFKKNSHNRWTKYISKKYKSKRFILNFQKSMNVKQKKFVHRLKRHSIFNYYNLHL